MPSSNLYGTVVVSAEPEWPASAHKTLSRDTHFASVSTSSAVSAWSTAAPHFAVPAFCIRAWRQCQDCSIHTVQKADLPLYVLTSIPVAFLADCSLARLHKVRFGLGRQLFFPLLYDRGGVRPIVKLSSFRDKRRNEVHLRRGHAMAWHAFATAAPGLLNVPRGIQLLEL